MMGGVAAMLFGGPKTRLFSCRMVHFGGLGQPPGAILGDSED